MSAADVDAKRRPRDPKTGEPLEPRADPGYYPGYSTLSQQRFWDRTTRETIVQRIESGSGMQYFSAEEERFWTTVFAHLIPQDDRTQERRIPIVPSIDRRLAIDATSGYRFADMPPDREAYQCGARAIDAEARAAFGVAFVDLDFARAETVLHAIHDGAPRAAHEIWREMSVHRFWQLIMGDAIEAYYAHPWAWDEIGFGGPAYPRAYIRLEHGAPEPWEVEEQRYEWAAPRDARSDEVENVHGFHTEAEQHRSHAPKTSRT